jgi:hypothetical protein
LFHKARSERIRVQQATRASSRNKVSRAEISTLAHKRSACRIAELGIRPLAKGCALQLSVYRGAFRLAMANAASPISPRFRLTICMRDGWIERSASIDYSSSELLYEQARQLDNHILRYLPYDLITFKNEFGETLALVARMYNNHFVSTL